MGCVFPMVVVSILPYAEFGPNDYREDASHCISRETGLKMYFSAVVWMGDMNFRIRDFTREEVISKVQGKKITVSYFFN